MLLLFHWNAWHVTARDSFEFYLLQFRLCPVSQGLKMNLERHKLYGSACKCAIVRLQIYVFHTMILVALFSFPILK